MILCLFGFFFLKSPYFLQIKRKVALPFVNCVTLDKYFCLSVPQFTHLTMVLTSQNCWEDRGSKAQNRGCLILNGPQYDLMYPLQDGHP